MAALPEFGALALVVGSLQLLLTPGLQHHPSVKETTTVCPQRLAHFQIVSYYVKIDRLLGRTEHFLIQLL